MHQPMDLHVNSMNYKAPIEQIDVLRNIYIPEQGTYFLVKEWFSNQLPIGRVHNVVQHSTIAAPFLTEETIINTNATLGFDQRTNFTSILKTHHFPGPTDTWQMAVWKICGA
jgi:hypothetical protein